MQGLTKLGLKDLSTSAAIILKIATNLITLLMYEEIEQQVVQPMTDRGFYPDAMRIINRIKNS